MHLNPLLLFLALTISLAAVNLIRENLNRQFIDIPNDRSSHKQPTPRGGGLGFILSFSVVLFLQQLDPTDVLPNSIPNSLWLSLIPLILVGLLDDRTSLPARLRYAVQILVATGIVLQCGAFPQPWFSSLGLLGSGLAILASIIGMTALINFYNFMDGLDGLVAGVTAVQLGFFAIWFDQPLLWYLVVALLGFLYWNWSPAKIFMGDVGSTTLGAVVALVLLFNQGNIAQSWTALAVTLPLIGDAIYTLICRLQRRENIFQAHRSHLYQRLHQSGWTHSQVAGVYIGLTLSIAVSLIIFKTPAAWLSLLMLPVLIWLTERYLTYRRKLNPELAE